MTLRAGTDGFKMKDPDRPLRWSLGLWGGPALERCGAQTVTAEGNPYRMQRCGFCQCCEGALFALPQYSYIDLPGEISPTHRPLSFHN